MEEALTPGPNFNRPVKDLVYKDLLTSTFTQGSHDRGIKTWCVSVSYPQCVFYGNKFRYEAFNVECQWTPTLEKQQSVRKGLLQRAKNHYQRRVVLIGTVFWKCMQTSAHGATKNFACRSECIGKTQPDFGWRLCRHSCTCRCNR